MLGGVHVVMDEGDAAVLGDDVAGTLGDVTAGDLLAERDVIALDDVRSGAGDRELARAFSAENLLSVSTLSADMPMTVPPALVKAGMASANACASALQPPV